MCVCSNCAHLFSIHLCLQVENPWWRCFPWARNHQLCCSRLARVLLVGDSYVCCLFSSKRLWRFHWESRIVHWVEEFHLLWKHILPWYLHCALHCNTFGLSLTIMQQVSELMQCKNGIWCCQLEEYGSAMVHIRRHIADELYAALKTRKYVSWKCLQTCLTKWTVLKQVMPCSHAM